MVAYPVESFGLEDVPVNLVEFPPSSGSSAVDGAILSLAGHPGGRRDAREY